MAFFHAVLGIFVLGGIVLLPVLLPIAATARGALKANDSTSKGSFNDLDKLAMGHIPVITYWLTLVQLRVDYKKRARGCGRFFRIGLHRYFEQLVDKLDASHPLLSVLRMPQLQRLLHSGADSANQLQCPTTKYGGSTWDSGPIPSAEEFYFLISKYGGST